MTADTKPVALPVEGIIKALSQKEGKRLSILVSYGPGEQDERWYIKSDYPDEERGWTVPGKGDRVRLMVTQGRWAQSCEVLEAAQATLGDVSERAYESGDRRQELIVAQTCLKVAGEIVASHVRPEWSNMDALADAVIVLKRRFEAEILGSYYDTSEPVPFE